MIPLSSHKCVLRRRRVARLRLADQSLDEESGSSRRRYSQRREYCNPYLFFGSHLVGVKIVDDCCWTTSGNQTERRSAGMRTVNARDLPQYGLSDLQVGNWTLRQRSCVIRKPDCKRNRATSELLSIRRCPHPSYPDSERRVCALKVEREASPAPEPEIRLRFEL